MNWISACVTPMKPRMKFKNTAARMISMIMAVVRIVPSKASRSILNVNARFQAANMSAKQTPTDAASVGVDPKRALHAEELAGLGVKGIWEGEEVLVGNEALLVSEGIDVSVSLKEIVRQGADRGETVVFVSRGEEVWGII